MFSFYDIAFLLMLLAYVHNKFLFTHTYGMNNIIMKILICNNRNSIPWHTVNWRMNIHSHDILYITSFEKAV